MYVCVHVLKLKPLLSFLLWFSKRIHSFFHKYALCKLQNNNTMRKAVSNWLSFLYNTSGSILNAIFSQCEYLDTENTFSKNS